MLLKTTLLILLLHSFGAGFGQKPITAINVDTTITGFKYAANFEGMAVYTKNGISDITSTTQPSAFSLSIFQEMTVNQAKLELLQLIKMSTLSGYQLRDRFEKDTIINGNKAYLISYREILESENYENRVFNGIIELKGAVLIFTSGDLEKGKYMASFIKTFYSLTK